MEHSEEDRIRVLHVDDEPELASLVTSRLESLSNRLTVASETNPRTVPDRAAGFDAIVTDYQMPQLDGLGLVDRVRADRPQIPMVIFTGEGSEGVASEAIRAGVDDGVTLARQGDRINEWDRESIAEAAQAVWSTTAADGAELTLADDLGEISCDVSGLQQVFANLLRNAITHGDGDESITVEPLDDGFAVADDGPGIPPEQRNRVFGAGFTTADQGTGYGLAIVKSIVDAHNWAIELTESDAGGARFEIIDAEVHR